MPTPCEQEKSIKDIRFILRELAADIKVLVSELRNSAIENRELRVRSEASEKNNVVLFKRVRRLEDELLPHIEDHLAELNNWKSRISGGMMAMMAIPTVASVIAIIVAGLSFISRA